MSSTGQATLSTDNVNLIINALADYARETGIDLSRNPFAASSNSQDLLTVSFNYSRSGRRHLRSIAATIGD